MDQRRLRTFLLGGAVGALAGILLAPRSGRELRGSLKDRAGEARERSRESYFQAQERMQERLAGAREGYRRTPGPESETSVGPAAPDAPGQTPETAPSRPPLRDVSWDAGQEPAGERPEDPEDLRRRVRETRARLRARLDKPAGPDAAPGEDHEE